MPDSKIVLYHGSIDRVEVPLAHVGRMELDFGPGFYLTNDWQQAVDWAKTKAGRKPGSTPILNKYLFESDAFLSTDKYKRLVFPDYSIEWLDFVSNSRKGKKPWTSYDCVEGGVANDSVISTVDAYVDGLINAEQAIGKLINERLRLFPFFCRIN